MFEISPIDVADLDSCLGLSAEAGWNQNASDWRLILDQGHTVGLRRPDGALIATAAVLPYGGRFGWICMVLVTAAERRRGHASRLVGYCLDWLSERGLIRGLDATPAGREVYRGLGFEDIYAITRLQSATVTISAAPHEADVDIARFELADLDGVAAYDAEAFGANRLPILASLRSRQPSMAFVARRRGAVCGFVVARDGRSATQLGPVVADDSALARALMAQALAHAGGPTFVDLADHHRDIAAWLAALGFVAQRPYMRMLVGRSQPLDCMERIVAIAGPELG